MLFSWFQGKLEPGVQDCCRDLSCLSLTAGHSHYMGNWNLRKKDLLLSVVFVYCTGFIMWHLFFPQDSSIYLVHRIVGFDFAVILVYPFIFCMRHNLTPAPEKELVASASVFQDCHPIRSPSMSEAFRCQMGKNTCKPCQSLDMQLTAATQKKSTTESQTWFASFTICSTREDGIFWPRHMLPDSRAGVKEENLGLSSQK